MDESDRSAFADARHVMDFSVGFRFLARLFRPPMRDMEANHPPPYRFALVVSDRPAAGPDEPPALFSVTASDSATPGTLDLLLHVAERHEVQGSLADPPHIDLFVERAGQIVCDHLGVDRGSFRPVPGSEEPAPWHRVRADARLCVACGAAIDAGDDSCAYCGAPPRR